MKYILLPFFVFSMSAFGASVSEQFYLFQQIAYTATTTSVQVLPANINRGYLLIQNNGATTINVKIGSIQSGTEGIVVASSGGSVEFKVTPTDSIWIKSSSATDAVAIIEGNVK